MKAADEAAFTEFVSGRWAALYRTAYLLTGNRHDAEDLLQTALANTYVGWGRIRDRGATEAYVRRSLVNAASRGWRKRGRTVPTDRCPTPATTAGIAGLADRPCCGGRSASCRPGCGRRWCSATTRTSPRPRPPRRSAARWARSRARPTTRSSGCAPRSGTTRSTYGRGDAMSDVTERVRETFATVGRDVPVPPFDELAFRRRVVGARRRRGLRVGRGASRWRRASRRRGVRRPGAARRRIRCAAGGRSTRGAPGGPPRAALLQRRHAADGRDTGRRGARPRVARSPSSASPPRAC